jgi:hypothetical protein
MDTTELHYAYDKIGGYSCVCNRILISNIRSFSPFSSDEVYWTEIDRISIRKAWLFGHWSCTIGLIYIIMESVFITPPLLTHPVLFSASHREFHV